MKFKWRLSLSCVVLSAVLAGCSTPQQSTTPSTPVSAEEQQRNKAEALLAKAQKSSPQKAASLSVEAAKLFLSLGLTERATVALDLLEPSYLPENERFQAIRLQADTALEQNNGALALKNLDLLEQPNNFTPEEQKALLQLKADALALDNLTVKQFKTLIKLSLLATSDEELQDYHDRIWKTLRQIEASDLTNMIRSGTNSYYEQGWLELMNELSINKQLDSQHQAISNWSALWENHPAKRVLPSALSGINSSASHFSKIAILLPNEGKLSRAAAAIKEGFLMAHLRNQKPGVATPELLFLDSTQVNTAIQLAALISEQNIDLVIGPLNKDLVTDLARDNHINTPILALNYAVEEAREGFYQFGLSAADEARQIAQKSWQDGVRRAGILTPDTAWGQKVADEFSLAFTELGGQVITRNTFGATEAFSDDISHFLNTDKSKARYKQLRSAVNTRKMEFEEHRRQDIDAIILTALPNDARQITPILAFNFAGDLPIYATSHVYSGTHNPIQDQDLNRIRFLDIPWSLNPPSQNKVLLSQERNDTSTRFGRLYALGLDAYQIYPYLQQLSSLPGAELQGETGRLSIANNGSVIRTMPWAVFRDGIPQPIE